MLDRGNRVSTQSMGNVLCTSEHLHATTLSPVVSGKQHACGCGIYVIIRVQALSTRTSIEATTACRICSAR
jgi:hypothetical protein